MIAPNLNVLHLFLEWYFESVCLCVSVYIRSPLSTGPIQSKSVDGFYPSLLLATDAKTKVNGTEMGNAFMKSVLIWVSSRFGEASHRIRHILTHLFMDHCQTGNSKKHYEEKREKKPRTQHIRLYIHSNWNLHITFPHVLHRPKWKFYGIISDLQLATIPLRHSHVTCSFSCSRCVCVCVAFRKR